MVIRPARVEDVPAILDLIRGLAVYEREPVSTVHATEDELRAALFAANPAVRRICVERGYSRFEWHVLDWKVDAARFYSARGARKLDEWDTWRLDPRLDPTG